MSFKNLYDVDARLYIAGVLMPATSISVTSSVNAPPVATIAVPPYPEMFGIGRRDRIPVQIFIKDVFTDSGEHILLFEGEITSFMYSSNATGRDVVINAQHILSYLRDTSITFMKDLNDMATNAAPGQGVATVGTVGGLTFPASLFTDGIQPLDASAKPIKTPSQILNNTYKFLYTAAGPNNKDIKPAYKPANSSVLAEYYGNYSRNIRLMQRYVDVPYFDNKFSEWSKSSEDDGFTFPLLEGVQTQKKIELMAGRVQSSGSQTMSIFDILHQVVGDMEYEYAMFSSPTFIGDVDKYEKQQAEKKRQEEEAAGKSTTTTQDGAQPPVFSADNSTQAAASLSAAEKKQTSPAGEEEDEFKNFRVVSSVMKPMLYEALPPKCNILFSTHVTSLNTQEYVYRVPTRVRTQDIYGPLGMLSGGDSSVLGLYGMLDYYPTKNGESEDASLTSKQSFSAEMLDHEAFTGPYLYDTAAPNWLSYVSYPKEEKESVKAFKDRVLRHMYLLKVYEHRRFSVQCVLNPYVTAGFPGVVFDANDSNFAFAGHVVAVAHNISKTDASTSVELAFARTLDEAISKDTRLDFILPQISDLITHKEDKMRDVYSKILGTDSVSFSQLETAHLQDEQGDPVKAYKYNHRKVTTFREYCAFMGLKTAQYRNLSGEKVPSVLTGDFVEKRYIDGVAADGSAAAAENTLTVDDSTDPTSIGTVEAKTSVTGSPLSGSSRPGNHVEVRGTSGNLKVFQRGQQATYVQAVQSKLDALPNSGRYDAERQATINELNLAKQGIEVDDLSSANNKIVIGETMPSFEDLGTSASNNTEVINLTGVRAVLKNIADREFSTQIYN